MLKRGAARGAGHRRSRKTGPPKVAEVAEVAKVENFSSRKLKARRSRILGGYEKLKTRRSRILEPEALILMGQLETRRGAVESTRAYRFGAPPGYPKRVNRRLRVILS
jgi:hypothetical protein